jgi:hypothetical protein
MGNMPLGPKPVEFTAQQVMDDPVLRYFSYAHLPEPLRSISESFCTLAAFLVTAVPRNAERSVALRKLLEAKDAGVRANVATPIPSTYKTRLADEYRELSERLRKLREFIVSPEFMDIDEKQRKLLTEQFEVMTHYSKVLGERIAVDTSSVDGEIKVTGGDKAETPIPFD